MCHAECHGKEEFTQLLDSRKDSSQRSKGLITGMLGSQRKVPRADILTESVDRSFKSYQRVRPSNGHGR